MYAIYEIIPRGRYGARVVIIERGHSYDANGVRQGERAPA